jgi:hypothetical protein
MTTTPHPRLGLGMSSAYREDRVEPYPAPLPPQLPLTELQAPLRLLTPAQSRHSHSFQARLGVPQPLRTHTAPPSRSHLDRNTRMASRPPKRAVPRPLGLDRRERVPAPRPVDSRAQWGNAESPTDQQGSTANSITPPPLELDLTTAEAAAAAAASATLATTALIRCPSAVHSTYGSLPQPQQHTPTSDPHPHPHS